MGGSALLFRKAQDGVKGRPFFGQTGLLGRGLGALDIHVHGFTVPRRLLLVLKLTAAESASNVLAKSLDNTHVLQPAVILLVPLARGIATAGLGLGRGRADREG
jgi:hypothetical protein